MSSEPTDSGRVARQSPVADDDVQTGLKRYGIAPVEMTVYEWGGYRYTNAHDAIAAAKRGAS